MSSAFLRTRFGITREEMGSEHGNEDNKRSVTLSEPSHYEGDTIVKSEQDGPCSPSPAGLTLPEGSSQTPEWSTVSASSIQFPSTETMGTSIPGHDPNRIPSSIFSSKPSTPIEWSVASNESLFSIHMGNNSFSRDQAVLPGKSGELTKPDKSSDAKSREHTETKPIDLNNTPRCLPTVTEGTAGSCRKSGSMREKVVVKETTEDHIKESMPLAHGPGTPSSTSRLSDGSGNSAKSFAFPVLACEAGKCASETVAPETLPSNTPEKPQLQPRGQLETPNSSLTRWFSCFSTCCFFSVK